MILKRNPENLRQLEKCHGGSGLLWCSEILADYQKKESGFAFIHDNVIEPNASIGELTHAGDEEIYLILSGHEVMRVDGVDHAVGEGDVCLTRCGHSHSLQNSSEGPMHFLVINTKINP